ncbi:hypothetical protein [uncultured Legionella sp.]|uniref:hypothetical protein n=1 Tax=uncultured Legionella sp. TaxID=210934 RepID=UPI002638E4AC|nr:hypothetical protein [uncultured Legionella sp.]
MIITPQEASKLEKHVSSLEVSWLSTNSGTVLLGKRPKGMLQDPNYLSLQEQIRFFNGEISSLLTQKDSIG